MVGEPYSPKRNSDPMTRSGTELWKAEICLDKEDKVRWLAEACFEGSWRWATLSEVEMQAAEARAWQKAGDTFKRHS